MTGSLFAPGRTDDLESLRNKVLTCRQCALSQTRNNVIFGEGFVNAGIMIIGEAPGRDEDIQGRPFVGLSGQLLDKIMDACGFTRREHVYISNIVKCRPPDNRVPSPAEAEICLPWLLNQIEIINPKIMILLGATALKYMTGPNLRITRDHGKWISCYDRLTMPVYHPAALLRDPRLKRDTWEDFKNVVFKYRELIDPQHYSAHV
ncbi:MAG: uracil-DNA glycosylase [Bacteroidales bacterium]|jgi:DNA polymerase|nr:uracil-DNA glycosylase [Bacteroidales bacterium]